jgi:serine/threonine protein kinase
MYEIICRATPFESGGQQRTFEKIVHSQKHLSFPPDFNPHCKSLIRRLLHPNAALRLGALQNGIDDIKNHAFFTMQGLNFADLLEQRIPMTYIPPAYDPSKSKPLASHTNIDSMDLEFERSVQLEDDYDGYFDNLVNPDLADENWL